MENFWFACLGLFERELSAMQFNTLIKPLKLESNGDVLRIVAPNTYVLQTLRENFVERIKQLGQDFFSRPLAVELVVLVHCYEYLKNCNLASTSCLAIRRRSGVMFAEPCMLCTT